MQVNHLRAALAVTISVLLVSACGLGSNLAPSSTTSVSAPISGTVADGYLAGARVFLDKNANGVFDIDEPSALTDGSGKFVLTGTSRNDLASFRLIAIVPKTASDADVGGFVPNAYYLTFPAGGPNPPFISPLSTLVDMKMKVAGLTLDEAFVGILNDLGVQMPGAVTAADALDADFVAIAGVWGGGATQVAQKIKRVSRVLVNGLGRALDAARTTMNVAGDNADSPNPVNEVQRFKLVMVNVLDQLDAVVAAAESLPVSPTQAHVDAQGALLAPAFLGQNLKTQSMIVGQVAQPLDAVVSSISLNDMPDDGVYAIRGRSGPQYDLARMFTSRAGDAVTIASVDPRGGQVVSSSVSLLSTDSASSWISAHGLFDSPWFDGARLTTASTGGVLALPNGPGFRLSAAKYNLAGKSLEYALLGNGLTSANGFQVGGAFPAGSEAFRLTFLAREDSYVLLENLLIPDHVSLGSFLAAYPTNSTFYFAPGEGKLRMQFDAGGAVWFFDLNGNRLAPDGQWRTETVRGKDLLRLLVIPEQFKIGLMDLGAKDEPFVALDNAGKLRMGVMIRRGSSLSFDGLVFNKTALNAINAANAYAPVP